MDVLIVSTPPAYEVGQKMPLTQTPAGLLRVTGEISNWPAVTHVIVDSMPQSGGGLTNTELRASAVPVSGQFFQATQPVSIASMPSTPVTGTFWQATQPVSGPLTDVQLRASAVPVSGFPAWPYPSTVTPVAAHSSVSANQVATATLAAAASKFTYLTSVQIFATGATAAGAQNATITGLLGGTLTIPFAFPAGVNLGAVPVNIPFAVPLRSSAVNTAIIVTLPALGAGNTRATVNAQGFQL